MACDTHPTGVPHDPGTQPRGRPLRVPQVPGPLDAGSEGPTHETGCRATVAQRQQQAEAVETPPVKLVERGSYDIFGRSAVGCARIGRQHGASVCGRVRFGGEVYSLPHAIGWRRRTADAAEPCRTLDNRLKWVLVS